MSPRDYCMKMHVTRMIAIVCWMDKKPVLLASTAAPPIAPLDTLVTVPRFVGSARVNIPTSPMHLQYTTYMRGVDLCDQLRGTYSTLPKTHKWWHRIFFFLLDTSLVNAWLLHNSNARAGNELEMSHRDFQLVMAEEVTSTWKGRMAWTSAFRPTHATIYVPLWQDFRRVCKMCKKRTRTMCAECGDKFLCVTPCYMKCHFSASPYLQQPWHFRFWLSGVMQCRPCEFPFWQDLQVRSGCIDALVMYCRACIISESCG